MSDLSLKVVVIYGGCSEMKRITPLPHTSLARAPEKEFKISQPSSHAYDCQPQQTQSAAEQQTENSCLPTLSFLTISELFILYSLCDSSPMFPGMQEKLAKCSSRNSQPKVDGTETSNILPTEFS